MPAARTLTLAACSAPPPHSHTPAPSAPLAALPPAPSQLQWQPRPRPLALPAATWRLLGFALGLALGLARPPASIHGLRPARRRNRCVSRAASAAEGRRRAGPAGGSGQRRVRGWRWRQPPHPARTWLHAATATAAAEGRAR
jgi:hypothetical protein